MTTGAIQTLSALIAQTPLALHGSGPWQCRVRSCEVEVDGPCRCLVLGFPMADESFGGKGHLVVFIGSSRQQVEQRELFEAPRLQRAAFPITKEARRSGNDGQPTMHAKCTRRAPFQHPPRYAQPRFRSLDQLEATPRFELGIEALQASALPLGDVAVLGPYAGRYQEKKTGRSGPQSEPSDQPSFGSMERTTGFEPATPTLARLCSTN